jgi:hypothetical protein
LSNEQKKESRFLQMKLLVYGLALWDRALAHWTPEGGNSLERQADKTLKEIERHLSFLTVVSQGFSELVLKFEDLVWEVFSSFFTPFFQTQILQLLMKHEWDKGSIEKLKKFTVQISQTPRTIQLSDSAPGKISSNSLRSGLSENLKGKESPESLMESPLSLMEENESDFRGFEPRKSSFAELFKERLPVCPAEAQREESKQKEDLEMAVSKMNLDSNGMMHLEEKKNCKNQQIQKIMETGDSSLIFPSSGLLTTKSFQKPNPNQVPIWESPKETSIHPSILDRGTRKRMAPHRTLKTSFASKVMIMPKEIAFTKHSSCKPEASRSPAKWEMDIEDEEASRQRGFGITISQSKPRLEPIVQKIEEEDSSMSVDAFFGFKEDRSMSVLTQKINIDSQKNTQKEKPNDNILALNTPIKIEFSSSSNAVPKRSQKILSLK